MTLVDGSFDPIHPGHLSYFHKARSFGYPLVCNVCPDSYTQTKHPILLPAKQRAQVLDSLTLVNHVHVSEVPTEIVLRELQPAIYAKGDGWRGKLPLAQMFACDENETRVEFTGPSEGSSTQMLRQFQSDVDVFERLVLSQKPAAKPWEPVTPYDFESRKKVEGPHAQLIFDTFTPTSVLDVGCGAGYLLTLLRAWCEAKMPRWSLALTGCDVRDVRYSPGFRFMKANIVTDEPVLADSGWYDLVICREVLEHLTIRELRAAVTSLCQLTHQFVYVTTRYAKQPASLLSVDTSDDLDPTHMTMLNKDFLRTLFVLEGFKRRADLEARMDWKKLGRCLVYERAA